MTKVSFGVVLTGPVDEVDTKAVARLESDLALDIEAVLAEDEDELDDREMTGAVVSMGRELMVTTDMIWFG